MKKLWSKRCGTVLIYAVLVSMAVYLLGSLLSGGRLLTSVFFRNTQDAFMDFFNSIRDASQGLGAYTERKVIYPPMANLIFYWLSFLTPDAYNGTSFADRQTWMNYPSNIALIAVCVAVCLLLLWLVVFCSLRVERRAKWAFSLVAVLSVPCLNVLERGNLMVLAFLALLIYALTYHSKSALLRELGLIALAFSFSLKLYPVLFAWILLGDKRYKEFFRCALYCLALLILPSFAFGGPRCLLIILQNIFSFSTGSGGVLAVISRYSGIPSFLVNTVAYGWFLLCGIHFAMAPFFYRAPEDRWRVWTLGCIAFLAFPSLTSTYAWALFLIPLIALYNDGVRAKETLGYLIPMVLPFLFFPIPLPGPVTVNAVVVYLCLVAISAYAMLDTLRRIRGRMAERRRQGETA